MMTFGLLCCLQCRLQFDFASLVFPVGQHDENFAAHFVLQQFPCGEPDGIVKVRGAPGVSGRKGSRRPDAAAVDLTFVNRLIQHVQVSGEVLKQLHVHVEMQHEGQILGTHHFAQEGFRLRLFLFQHAALAGAGVNQNAHGERSIRFAGEVFDLLRLLILFQGKVVLVEVGNQMTVLLPHHRIHIHHFGGGLEGSSLRGNLFGLLCGGVTGCHRKNSEY